MSYYYYRDKKAIGLHRRTCAVLLLAIIGAMEVVNGWYLLDWSKLRVALCRDGVAIDGGVGEFGMGLLMLYGAYSLLLEWFGD